MIMIKIKAATMKFGVVKQEKKFNFIIGKKLVQEMFKQK